MNKKAIKTGGISRDTSGGLADTYGGFITGAEEIQATGDI